MSDTKIPPTTGSKIPDEITRGKSKGVSTPAPIGPGGLPGSGWRSSRPDINRIPEQEVDAKADLQYKLPNGGGIEVEGVCKVSEDSIRCWSSSGKDLPSLSDQVKAYYEKQSYSSYPIQFGKKNRLIVVKETHLPYAPQAGAMPKMLNVSGVQGYNATNSVHFPQEMSRIQPNDPSVTRRGFVVAVEKEKKNVSLLANETQPITERCTMPCKVGASGKIGSVALKIRSVAELPQNTNFSYGPQRMWVVRVDVQNPPTKPWRFQPQCLNANGKPAYMMDDKGNLLGPEDSAKMNQQFYSRSSGGPSGMSRPPMTPINLYTSGAGKDFFEFRMTVNPAKIPNLQISAYSTRTIEIKGVRLDP